MSTEQVELSVVVPCHNEEDAIADCHADLVRVLDGAVSSFEIIYVNDGSSDATSAALRDLRARDTHGRFIEFSRNFGQAAAHTISGRRSLAVVDQSTQGARRSAGNRRPKLSCKLSYTRGVHVKKASSGCEVERLDCSFGAATDAGQELPGRNHRRSP